MDIQMRYKTIIKNAAKAALPAIMLACLISAPAVSAASFTTAKVLAHPPVTGDCASCHPEQKKPKRTR